MMIMDGMTVGMECEKITMSDEKDEGDAVDTILYHHAFWYIIYLR
jgi:hypothetical protein